LINAVDALEGKKGEVNITTARAGNLLKMIFEDTGKGISNENLAKIFDPFYTTKKPGEGTGLGLWVSYGIVKNFGGDIRVESQLGNGSTFTVLLPILTEEKSV
jgi:signal transduction histidine kinase